jgi:tRNA-specific 2-thiouridylase
LMYYTRGQRQGLGLGGLAGFTGEPWYVADKDLANNTLIVVQGHRHPLLLGKWLKAEQVEWVQQEEPEFPLHCTAKTRYRQQDAACVVTKDVNDWLNVEFAEPQWAVTLGQSVVFYQDEVCLGGGIINATEKFL